jgi:hypothetical protein
MAARISKMALGSLIATVVTTVSSFAPQSFVSRPVTLLNVAVDPTTVSKKDYEDICGLQFTGDEMAKRLQRTSYLYPKHVEVIEDIAPIADQMVNDIVSQKLMLSSRVLCYPVLLLFKDHH